MGKCADYQPEANSQTKEQLKKLKNFETENRKLNEKVEIGKKTEESENLKEQEYLTELQNFEMENAKINTKENAAAKIKEKDQIKKLKQLEKENATGPEQERKREKEKQMQMRRQAYLEQLETSHLKDTNQSEAVKSKNKEGSKQTKKTKKKDKIQKEKEKIHELMMTKEKEPITEPKIVELFSDDEIENNTTNQNLQTEPSVKDKINEDVKSNEQRDNEVPNRGGRPQATNRTAHERFTLEEKLEARSRSRRPLTPRLAETLQNDPLYAYEVYDDRRVINPMNHEIIDGQNKKGKEKKKNKYKCDDKHIWNN